VVHLVLIRHGEGFRVVPWADADGLPLAAAEEERTRLPPSLSATLQHEQALLAVKDELVRSAERLNALELDAARDRADRFAEDCLYTPRQQVDRAREDWEEARRAVLAIDEPAERMKARAKAERLEREYRRKLTQLRHAEEQRYTDKDRTIAALAQKSKVVAGRTLIASAYFWVD
jgi:hypothetical protein